MCKAVVGQEGRKRPGESQWTVETPVEVFHSHVGARGAPPGSRPERSIRQERSGSTAFEERLEDKKHADEMAFLKRTNGQLKTQLENFLQPASKK